MLIHDDVDDERTLDEEEILQGDEDFTDELDDLQKVRLMRMHPSYTHTHTHTYTHTHTHTRTGHSLNFILYCSSLGG